MPIERLEPTRAHRAGTGEPLLLLHGFTDSWRAWMPVLPELERHHDVLAPTLPGHHGGPPVEEHSVEWLLSWCEQVLDDAGWETAHLVGSSLGGWLALRLAARGRARSVVGICPAGGWYDGSREAKATRDYFVRNDRLLRLSRRRLPQAAHNPALRWFGLRQLIADPRSVDRVHALRMMEGAAACDVRAALPEGGHGPAFFGELGPIAVPVRIAYGEKDRVITWPRHYPRLRQLLPDAEWVELAGCGHLPMWDDAELVARTVLEVTDPR